MLGGMNGINRNGGDRRDVELSFPKYTGVGEATVVDLSGDGLPFVPVLGETHYSRIGPDPDRHVHPGMVEILLCRRGRGISIDCGDCILPFPTGTVMVMQPGTPHTLRLYPKGLSTMWIWFKLPKRGEALAGLSRVETRWLAGKLRALPMRLTATKDLEHSFQRLWRLYRDVPRKAPERKLLMREAVFRLLADVMDASAASCRESTDSRLSATLEAIRDDCARDWTLEELASRAAMSVPTLTERIRRKTGLPPHQFLVACRMEKAKEALVSTNRSVAAIAGDLGIATAQHFATMFRRETGMTPREWRNRHRE